MGFLVTIAEEELTIKATDVVTQINKVVLEGEERETKTEHATAAEFKVILPDSVEPLFL